MVIVRRGQTSGELAPVISAPGSVISTESAASVSPVVAFLSVASARSEFLLFVMVWVIFVVFKFSVFVIVG